MAQLTEGMKAPDFKSVNQNGDTIALSDYKGKKIILFFYPKDNTPGCTAESCNLRDNYSVLQEKGFEVIGISPDSPKSHTNFINKFDLPYNLVADTEKEILKTYGAWGLKKNYGKEYEGVLRTTFLINEDGIIIKVFSKVNTKDHAEQILNSLEQ